MDRVDGTSQGLSSAASTQGGGRRWAVILAWVLLAAAAAKFCYRGPWRAMRSSSDLALYYTCALAWAEGSNPYDPENLRALAARTGDAPGSLLQNAISPPVTFVLLSPLALLSWPQARLAWLIVNLVLTGGMCFWLVRLAEAPWPSARAVLLLALVLVLAPLQTGLRHGQMALVSTAFLVGAIHAQRAERDGLAGVLLAVAGVFKPQLAAVFGLYWLCRRRWGAVLTAAGVAAAVTIVAVGRLHLADVPWWTQWRENIRLCFRGGACDYAVVGQAHIFINLQHPLYAIFASRQAATAIAWAFTAVLVVPAALAWRRTARGIERELPALAFLAVVCLLPVYHIFYDAVVLVLPLCWAVRAAGTALRRWAIAVVVLILPFSVSGAAALHVLGESGRVPSHWASSWWWRTLLLPHQPYLLAAMGVVMAWALLKGRAVRPAAS